MLRHSQVCIFLLAVLTGQLLYACSPAAQNTQGEQWVIFSEKQASEWHIADIFLDSGETAEYWTPSEKDILALENGLDAYLKTNPDRFDQTDRPIGERREEYNRQYIGIVLDGKRIIYANYFCDSIDIDWRKDFVFVMDGGDCFFQFKYDTGSAEFFDLQVNGNA